MTSRWEAFLQSDSDSGKESFPPFSELFSKTQTEELTKTQKQLEIYLNLHEEGRSLLHNLKDRKEFYRPDLYDHLYDSTLGKLQPSTKETPPSFRPNEGGLCLKDIYAEKTIPEKSNSK